MYNSWSLARGTCNYVYFGVKQEIGKVPKEKLVSESVDGKWYVEE